MVHALMPRKIWMVNVLHRLQPWRTRRKEPAMLTHCEMTSSRTPVPIVLPRSPQMIGRLMRLNAARSAVVDTTAKSKLLPA